MKLIVQANRDTGEVCLINDGALSLATMTRQIEFDDRVKIAGEIAKRSDDDLARNIQIPVVVEHTTLNVLSEHTTHEFKARIDISDRETIIALDGDVLGAILRAAEPDDVRIDQIIKRRAT